MESEGLMAEQLTALTTELFGIDKLLLKEALRPILTLMDGHSILCLSTERRGKEALITIDGKQILMVPRPADHR